MRWEVLIAMNTRSATPLGVHDLHCECQANPLGINVDSGTYTFAYPYKE